MAPPQPCRHSFKNRTTQFIVKMLLVLNGINTRITVESGILPRIELTSQYYKVIILLVSQVLNARFIGLVLKSQNPMQ